jgi:hypothetical protein
MQLVPRYLVSNTTTAVVDMAGFITEYRPVYNKQLQVYKGIDNVLDFRLLNADQKAIDLSSYTMKFVAFDENKNLVIEHDGVQLTSDGSTPIKGLFKVTVTENDLLNIKDQYLSYNIYLNDQDDTNVITYSNSHFGNDGIIKVNSSAFPGAKESKSISTFTQVTEDTPYWISESINAEPGINGNEALHTAAIYSDSYIGDIILQGTLDNQIDESTYWSDITTVSFTGSESEPSFVNFNGVLSHLRFKATTSPADSITKILIRN